jgi:parvulin-like peptidyl-prolyl isomerase
MMDGKLPEEKNSILDFPISVQENIVKSYLMAEIVQEHVQKDKFIPSEQLKQRLEMMRRGMVQREYILSKISDQEVENEAKKIYSERFKDKEEIKASHILVKEEKRAKEIHKQLVKNPKKFENFIEESLDTGSKASKGSLGYFVKGQMVPEFEQIAFATKVGALSKPVKTDFGWHIIKIEDKRMRPAPKYDDVKAQLIAEIQNQKMDQYLSRLYKNSGAKILLKDEKNNEAK